MNILLINYSLKSNYGGVLQSYALQEVLKGLGHNVVKVELRHIPKKVFTINNIILFFKRLILKFFFFEKNIDLIAEYHEAQAEVLIHKNARQFINQYISAIYVNSLQELNPNDYHAVIVGSDQVWRKSGSDRLLSASSPSDNAFLSFAQTWNCRRIAYAVSLGLDYWEYNEEETEHLSNLIKKFDAISVREDTAIDLLTANLNPTVEIKHLLDPTLLLDRNIFNQLFVGSTHKSKGNLLAYILDRTDFGLNCINVLENKYSLCHFLVNNPDVDNFQVLPQKRIQPPIEQWLRGFYDTEYVITDSFHACVFSIIYEKPFFVILNEKRGASRIYSLLKMFNLESRIIHTKEDLDIFSNEIEWEQVRKRLQLYRVKSISFLKESLKMNN